MVGHVLAKDEVGVRFSLSALKQSDALYARYFVLMGSTRRIEARLSPVEPDQLGY